MRPSIKSSTSPPAGEELKLAPTPKPGQLAEMAAHLDLLLLALQALVGIDSEAMHRAARELNLETAISDRPWLLKLSPTSAEERQPLDLEAARSRVLLINHLAQKHRETIRGAVALLEQIAAQTQDPHRSTLLNRYLDTFIHGYLERGEQQDPLSSQEIEPIALKLLLDLLFYSAAGGHRRLWLALID